MEIVIQPGISVVIFQYLSVSELLGVMSTSRAVRMCVMQDELWRDICALMFPYTPVSHNHFDFFQQQKSTFVSLAESLCGLLHYLEENSMNLRMMGSFSEAANPLMKQIYPKIVSTSDNYLSSFSIDPHQPQALFRLSHSILTEFSDRWNGEMPLELYYFYLLFNGQGSSHFAPSVLGSYKYNQIFVNPLFLPLQGEREAHNRWFTIGECPYSHLQILIDLENVLGHGNSAVCLSTSMHQTVLYIAPSLSSLFSSVVSKLESGTIELNEYLLDGFERNECASVAVTEGIEVEARAMFVPHQSEESAYIWAYEIRIRPNNPTRRWRLQTRRWEITDISGFRNVVEGNGVVGLFPEVYRGSKEVIYESCCKLQAVEGEMKGTFRFQDMDDPRQSVQATVAPFRLRLPSGSELMRIPRPRTSSTS